MPDILNDEFNPVGVRNQQDNVVFNHIQAAWRDLNFKKLRGRMMAQGFEKIDNLEMVPAEYVKEEGMKFEDTVIDSHKTGSRYICNPPVLDTDDDTVILVNGYYDYHSMLVNDGWEATADYDGTGHFYSFRKGDQNYIVTESPRFFNAYVVATETAKALNLLKKEDRIKLFQTVNHLFMSREIGEDM